MLFRSKECSCTIIGSGIPRSAYLPTTDVKLGEHSGPQQHRRLRYQPRIPMSFEFPDTHANIMINAALSTQNGRNHPGPPSSIRQYQEINKR